MTGSRFSTSWTMSGVPNRIAEARAFMKLESRNDVCAIFCEAYLLMQSKHNEANDVSRDREWEGVRESSRPDLLRRNRVACPEGSTTRGKRRKRSKMIPFSIQRSSLGSPKACHSSRCFERSEGVDHFNRSTSTVQRGKKRPAWLARGTPRGSPRVPCGGAHLLLEERPARLRCVVHLTQTRILFF